MEFFDGMAQKTKNISEIMKLTAAVSSEKERQEKIYRELGETYYKVYGDRAESELMEMCIQIRESREAVENYEKEILALKGIAVCPACGYEVSIHFNFCNNCGHKMKEIQEEQPSVDELIQEGEVLKQEEEVLAEEKAACESEQEPVNVPCEPDTAEEVGEPEAAEIICEPEAPQTADAVCEPEAPQTAAMGCEPEVPQTADMVCEPEAPQTAAMGCEPEVPQTADMVCEPEAPQTTDAACEPEKLADMEDFFLHQIQEAVNVSSEKVCKVCGAQMEADQEFCIMCGTKYVEDCREEAEEEPQERICPNCGSIVKPGHLFCMECGTKQ